MTDTQRRLHRNIQSLLGENTPLFRIYTYEEVLNMLLQECNNLTSIKTFIEFNGGVEPDCESRLKPVGFNFKTLINLTGTVVTRISW